jgi:hypothetical protein
VSNLGVHAPPQQPAFANDGTLGSAGYSSTPWALNQTANAVSWNSETFAQNQNANAIRYGTLYNFRFDSNRPPQATNATVGFFKSGAPITVAIQGPAADPCNPLQLLSAVSRLMHAGVGNFDIDMPLTGTTGVECRNGGGNYTLVVTFSNNMVSGNASVTSGAGNVVGSPTFSGHTMTINLTNVTNAQTTTVTLASVTDAFSQVLPTTALNASFLVGDTTGDGTVNSADIGQTKSQSGNAVTGSNFREDVNVDGNINASDVGLVKSKSGTALP